MAEPEPIRGADIQFRKVINPEGASSSNFYTWIHKFMTRKIQTNQGSLRSKSIGAQEVKQGECAWLTGQGETYTIAFFAFTEPPVVDYFPKLATRISSTPKLF